MVDRKRAFDLLIDLLDRELVKFQFQMPAITVGLVSALLILPISVGGGALGSGSGAIK